MGTDVVKEFPSHDQQVAVCLTQWKNRSNEMPDIERRIASMEVRLSEDGGAIEGYAAVFNSDSQELAPGFVERIAPGAFKRSIRGNENIFALFNHDPNIVLGRSGAGTLKLSEDETGLRMKVQLPDSPMAQSVRESITRGDITGQSFSFEVKKDSWQNEEGKTPVRTLEEVRLFDVGPVTFPAYLQTVVSARCMDQIGTSVVPTEVQPEESDSPEEEERYLMSPDECDREFALALTELGIR